MDAARLSDIAARCRTAGRITAEDVLAARRALYGEFTVTRQEIADLVALDEACEDKAREWDQLFVEAVTDFAVRQTPPEGYLDEAGAEALIALIARDGTVKTDNQLQAIVRVLETAEAVPDGFSTFALAQVKASVLADREGPHVSAHEVDLARRILYAAGGPGNIAITRSEAEALFDINDACRGARNDPAWTDLFAKAIAAAMMMVSGHRALAPEEALRRKAWLAAPEGGADGIGDFLVRSLDIKAGLREFFNPTDGLKDWRADVAMDEELRREAETVTGDEAEWLAARIGRDGHWDAAELAVIDFLKRETPQLHPRLQALLDELPGPVSVPA